MGLLDDFSTWAQSPQSQPAANGLLAAGLGILAHNRGLTSGSAAVGMGGLEGLQAYQQSKQQMMQQQLQSAQLQQLNFGLTKNKMLLGLAEQYLHGSAPGGGGTPPATGAAPTDAAPVAAMPGADAGGLPAGAAGSGPGVQSFPVPGAGSPAGTPQGIPARPAQAAAAAAPSAAGGAPTNGIFGNMPGGLVAMGLMTDPGKLFENAAAQYSPTDLMKTMRAAGIDPSSVLGKQILQNSIAKTNYIPPTRITAGGGTQNADGTITMTPSAAAPGYINQQVSPGNWTTTPVHGGLQAIGASSAAKASGPATYNVKPVWDPNYVDPASGRKGGFVNQTALNVANAAGIPSIPALPGSAPVAAGYSPPPLPPGMAGPGPAPAQSAPQAPAAAGGPPQASPAGGPMASEPPPGLVKNANAAQAAPAESMKDSYTGLQAGRSTAGAALDALNMMQGLAAHKDPLMVGPLGTALAPVSQNAAEYEKQRANVIQLLSKQGGLGTDAARALVGESVPDYGKPKAAIQEGLQTLVNQTKAQQLKADLLTPVYNAGDSQRYTQLENGFDQHITPALMPVLQLTGAQQRAAVQAAVKANPALRTNFEWAYNNGLLK